jgi:hypothetical protein
MKTCFTSLRLCSAKSKHFFEKKNLKKKYLNERENSFNSGTCHLLREKKFKFTEKKFPIFLSSNTKMSVSLLLTFAISIDFYMYYSVFQGFSKAKSTNGGSILSSSQFLILPQLPQKIKLTSKVVKVNSEIIISLPKI